MGCTSRNVRSSACEGIICHANRRRKERRNDFISIEVLQSTSCATSRNEGERIHTQMRLITLANLGISFQKHNIHPARTLNSENFCVCLVEWKKWSRLNFYEIQDLPLFLRRFWTLKRECSELHDQWKGKKRPKKKVKIEFRRAQTSNQIFVRKV